MTFSEPFMPHPKSPSPCEIWPKNRSLNAVTPVTTNLKDKVTTAVYDRGHPRSSSNYEACQYFPAVAPATNAGRRIGAGAGATPVSVALVRHDPFLPRPGSLVGRSRTWPLSSDCESQPDSH